jgi:hypothetical protein
MDQAETAMETLLLRTLEKMILLKMAPTKETIPTKTRMLLIQLKATPTPQTPKIKSPTIKPKAQMTMTRTRVTKSKTKDPMKSRRTATPTDRYQLFRFLLILMHLKFYIVVILQYI